KGRGRLVGRIGPDPFVCGKRLGVPVGGYVDGHELGGEVALRRRLGRPEVAPHPILVHLLPADPVLASDELCGDALWHQVVQLEQLGRERVAGALSDVGPHGHARHALDASSNRDVGDAALDQVRGEMDRLLARAALAIDGRCRGLDRKAGGEPGVAADVQALLPDLTDAAEDHVLDLAGLDTRAVDDLLENHRTQDYGMEVLELAVPPAEWRAHAFDDDRFTHDLPPKNLENVAWRRKPFRC